MDNDKLEYSVTYELWTINCWPIFFTIFLYALHVLNTRQIYFLALNRINKNDTGFINYGQRNTRVFSDSWIVNEKLLTNLFHYFSEYALHVLITKQLEFLGLNRIYGNGRGFINYGQQKTRVFSDLWTVND